MALVRTGAAPPQPQAAVWPLAVCMGVQAPRPPVAPPPLSSFLGAPLSDAAGPPARPPAGLKNSQSSPRLCLFCAPSSSWERRAPGSVFLAFFLYLTFGSNRWPAAEPLRGKGPLPRCTPLAGGRRVCSGRHCVRRGGGGSAQSPAAAQPAGGSGRMRPPSADGECAVANGPASGRAGEREEGWGEERGGGWGGRRGGPGGERGEVCEGGPAGGVSTPPAGRRDAVAAARRLTRSVVFPPPP